MSFPVHQGGEGSLSESVQFPPSNGFVDQQGNVERHLSMVPPLSSASRAPSRPPFHDDERVGSHCVHGGGGFDRSEYDYSMRSRHGSYGGEHAGLHSGALIEQLLLQENEKARRIASLVQSQQASGCLSGCFSCGLAEKRLRFKDHENFRLLAEQRWNSRSTAGEAPSKSVNVGMMDPEDTDSPDMWFRQLRPRQAFGGADEGVQGRFSFSGEELGHSMCQGRRSSCSGAHPGISASQASHHMQDNQLRPAGPAVNIAPVHGYSDGDGRFQQKWSNQRPIHSGINTEEEGWQSSSRSGARVALATARDQNHPTSISLPGLAVGSQSKNSGKSSHGVAATSVSLLQSQAFSEGRLGSRDSHLEASHQEASLQQAGGQLLVTQGPVTLTDWHLIRVQDAAVGRVLETRVAVGGLLFNSKEQVKTAPIVNRLDFRKVITEDGVEVSLEGSINQEKSIANGFSAGIVQCLSTGFPYLWKQYMRVRPVGQSSSLAMSGSLGGCDANASQAISKDAPSPSINCEAHSAADDAGARTEEPSKSDIPVKVISSTALSEQIQMVRTKAVESLETPDTAAVADPEIAMEKHVDNIVDSLDPGHTPAGIKMVRVEAHAEFMQSLNTTAVAVPEIALKKQPVHGIIDSLDPGPQSSVGIEGVEAVQSLRTLDTATVAGPKIAMDRELVDGIMDGLDPGPIPQPPFGIEMMRAEAMASGEALDTAAVADPEIAIEKQSVHNDIVGNMDSGPVSGARVKIMDTETSPKEGQDKCASLEPIKTSSSRIWNKTKKGSLQPVRSSRRLQQQLGLLEPDRRAVSTVVSAETTHEPLVGTSTSKVTRVSEGVRADNTSIGCPPVEMSGNGDAEPMNQGNDAGGAQAKKVEKVQQPPSQAERDKTKKGSLQPVRSSRRLQQQLGLLEPYRRAVSTVVSAETTHKPLVGTSASKATRVSEGVRADNTSIGCPPVEMSGNGDPEPMNQGNDAGGAQAKKVEKVQQPLSQAERDKDKSKIHNSHESEAGFRVIFRSLVSADPAPINTPEVTNKRTRGKRKCLDMPLSISEVNQQTTCFRRVSAEFSVPVTRSQKQLRRASDAVDATSAGPITSISVPVTRSSRSLHKLSDQAGPGTEPASRSVTPHQKDEMDAITPTPHSRKSGGRKIATCSRCEVPIIPHNVEVFGCESKDASIQRTFQQLGDRVQKMEQQDYTPIASIRSGGNLAMHTQHDEAEFRTPDVKEQPSVTQKKKKESATQSRVKTQRRKPKFSKAEDNEGMEVASSVGRSGGSRRSIIPPPLPPPRVQDKSKVSEAFGLKTSRSGRLLVPPLAYWRSQSIGYDMDGGIIAIFDGFEAKPADTGCFTFTPPQEEDAKKIQKKLCEAAITIPKRKR